MSATGPKSKKQRTKPPKSRPQSSSALSQPTTDTVIDLSHNPQTTSKSKKNESTKRYSEPPSLEVRSGVELGHDPTADDMDMREVDGHLDVNLAELSLGQRLTVISGNTELEQGSSDSEAEDVSSPSKQKQANGLAPTNSLTRTLIQALHSSDSKLLETCLSHSEPTLIRNTVQKLPPQLAVPLLNSCVERLSRGSRSANLKGGGGGASSQRGTVLLAWIKTVLVIHSGHLMTMPDLVARLSSLHATLSSRLALQESLLSLSGKLDMVLSQVELRSSHTPAAIASGASKRKGGKQANPKLNHYVEGESDEDELMEPGVEESDGSGSVEDIEFGKDQEDSDEDESEEDESGEDSGENETFKGFIDDEAEEDYEDDEDEEDSE